MKEFDFINDFEMGYIDEIFLKLSDSKKLIFFGASEGVKVFMNC